MGWKTFAAAAASLALAAYSAEEITNAPAEEKELAVKEARASRTRAGDTIENQAGSFTLLKRSSGVQTVTTDAFTIHVPQVRAVSGTVKEPYAQVLGAETIEYIQLEMEIAHTLPAHHSLSAHQARIVTSTGEQIEPNKLFSENIPAEFYGRTSRKGVNGYVLKHSKAEEIEWVRFVMDAPASTEDFDPPGKKVAVQIPFN